MILQTDHPVDALPYNHTGMKGLFSFFSSGYPEEHMDVFHTTVFRRLTSGELLTLRLLPLSKSVTKVECNLYGTESKSNWSSIDRIKREVQMIVEQLELRQHALLHDSANFASRE